MNLQHNLKDSLIWLDGKFVSYNDAKVHVLTHSLHYASSVFEGVRAYNQVPFKLEEHIDRLIYSAQSLKLDLKHTKQDLITATHQVIERNNLQNCYIRPLVWRGDETVKVGGKQNSTHAMIAAWTPKHYYSSPGQQTQATPLNLTISNFIRPTPAMTDHQAKSSGNYAMLNLAKIEAQEQGFDDAVMLDINHYIAECTASNIFFIDNQSVIHTPLPVCCLNGITRQTIIDIASKLGYKVIERDISLQEIHHFSECFLTGTAAELQKVQSISNRNDKIIFKNQQISDILLQEYRIMVLKDK